MYNCISSVICELKSLNGYFRINTRVEKTKAKAIMDSGATRLFMDTDWIKRNKIQTFPLKEAIKVCNIDEIENIEEKIERFVKEKLIINGKEKWLEFLVKDLKKKEVVLRII